MKEYSFFSYDAYDALHLSDRGNQMIAGIVKTIEQEYSQNFDEYSRDLILSHLEVLLNYCQHFYGRQFLTQTHVNKDVIGRFEVFLEEWFDSDALDGNRKCCDEYGCRNHSAEYFWEDSPTFLIGKAEWWILGG